jgi:hypothetical protein
MEKELHGKFELTGKQLKRLHEKDNVVDILSRANLFVNDKDLQAE